MKSAGSENVKWLTVQCDQADCLSHTINKPLFEPFCVCVTHILLGAWHCSYLGRKEQLRRRLIVNSSVQIMEWSK